MDVPPVAIHATSISSWGQKIPEMGLVFFHKVFLRKMEKKVTAA